MRIGIVGAGMSGLCMAAALRRAGHTDFVVFEKAASVGGTWRENTYPGVACDVPSRYYCYSFAPHTGWSRAFAPGNEIREYFTRFAENEDLLEHIRFGTELVGAAWVSGRWSLSCRDGHVDTVDVLVSATGILHHPRTPRIQGLETFAGAAFHSARWDHSVRVEGKKVAVVGTGSTGVQLTTALSQLAEQVTVFQRTPQWVLPVPDRPVSTAGKALFTRLPRLNRIAYRFHQVLLERTLGHAVIEPGLRRRLVATVCRLNLRLTVKDKALRARLTPSDEPMCRRLIMSAGYYRAVQRPSVDLVTEPIERITEQGIVTRDGRLHEADVIVLATGFDAHAYLRPIELVGVNGRTLEDYWADGPRAYQTVALPGFPNFFMLMGPHSPIGNHSLVAIAETQAAYIVAALRMLRPGHALHPTSEATNEFNAAMKRALPKTVWTTGCNSWYLGADGLPELWPWSPAHHRTLLKQPARQDFVHVTTETPYDRA